MSLFQKKKGCGEERVLPAVAVCFTTPAMTRRAADWLEKLGGCRPLAILSDDFDDVVWQCENGQADLLLLETDFSDNAEDRDVSGRCGIAVEIKRKRPDCRIYLLCADGHPERLPALDKAVELKLINGYFIGDLTPKQGREWIAEAAEALTDGKRRAPCTEKY